MLGGATAHTLLGADAIVASVDGKRRLHEPHVAAAVDLESGAVACIAAQHGVPFAVLRAICDPAERTLPPAALAALDAHGAIGMWRVIRLARSRDQRNCPRCSRWPADAAAARRSLAARVRQIGRAAAAQ